MKLWRTSRGEGSRLGTTEFVITDKDNVIGLQLKEEGIKIHSEKPIIMTAKKEVELLANQTIDIKAKEGLYLICGVSSIVMAGMTDIQGTHVEITE